MGGIESRVMVRSESNIASGDGQNHRGIECAIERNKRVILLSIRGWGDGGVVRAVTRRGFVGMM